MAKSIATTNSILKSSLLPRLPARTRLANPKLNKKSTAQLEAVAAALQNNNAVVEAERNIYKALFYGPKDTGKTSMTATLAKQFEKNVYRIDLSKLVSKFNSETEKNLNAIFKMAEASGSILLFDEADALFGKRTHVKDAHDKYANQEVSYLLQKIDRFNGVVIFETTEKRNLDPAFIRRLNAVVKFELPK